MSVGEAAVGPAWPALLAGFRAPSPRRSIAELAATALPFLALWIGMVLLVRQGAWWSLVLTVPAAGFLVRLFMIQHDCGHGAFFRGRRANDWLGRLLSIATLTPYDQWRRSHAAHHAAVGNLDRRGDGDIPTLTVREYAAAGPAARLRYRLIRHPLVLFGLGPAFLFLVQNRFPMAPLDAAWRDWLSPGATNLALATVGLSACLLAGPYVFLAVQLPIALLAATAGVWLFYVQHQFEDTFWEGDPDWVHAEAALKGSSFYDLPQPLRWFTADIGIHHVHHLSSRIPFYRLAEAMGAHPELKRVGRLTLWTSVRSIRLVLWDEDQNRLVSFRAMRSAMREGNPPVSAAIAD
jgi:omega-6 fatty acid desaturase (delta-12 desaturase)